MKLDLDPSWHSLSDQYGQPYMAALTSFLDTEKAKGARIFPAEGEYLRALELTPLDQVRVVILGQDPYHNEGQAHGLCFSVRPSVKIPPSLVNIYKELESDLGIQRPTHGFLEHWARQGVLLLNNTLTVEMGRAASHKGKGWEHFTDAIIRLVNDKENPVVFMLWGGPAQEKAGFVRDVAAGGRHLVLTSPHPSPLAAYRGFFGCRHFSKANAFLEEKGRGAIDWSLPDQP